MMALVLWATAAFTSALSGFAVLSLAMDRHYEDTFGRGKDPGARRRWMQAGGAMALVLSLAVCLFMAGKAQGWVLWFGELTAGAIVVVLTLTYVPQRAVPLTLASAAITLLAVLIAAFV